MALGYLAGEIDNDLQATRAAIDHPHQPRFRPWGRVWN